MKQVVSILFALNALFWGLAPHSMHCDFVQKLGVKDCPSHMVHLVFGIICFVIAVVLMQYDYVKMMM
jgi:hypothetical protein